jgi:hypothetical protein
MDDEIVESFWPLMQGVLLARECGWFHGWVKSPLHEFWARVDGSMDG